MISLSDKTDQDDDRVDLRDEALEQLQSSIERIDLIKINLSILKVRGEVKCPDYDMLNEELGRISVSILETEKILTGSEGERGLSKNVSEKEIIEDLDGPSNGHGTIRSMIDGSEIPGNVPANLSHSTESGKNDIVTDEHQIRPLIATDHRKAHFSKRSFLDHNGSVTAYQNCAVGGYESHVIDHSIQVKNGTRIDHSTTVNIFDHGEHIFSGLPIKNPISLADCKLPLSNNILASLKKMGLEFI